MNVITNQKPLAELSGFNGLYSRGSDTACPSDHLTMCVNCKFEGDNQVNIRERFTIQNQIANRNILSYFIAKTKIGAGLLTLNKDGQFWDETHNRLLLNVSGADDFTGINIFGRTYISFRSKGKALVNSATYYYDGINFYL